jgi:hypothetical protein
LNWFPKDNKRNLIGYSNRPISRWSWAGFSQAEWG